MTPRRTDFLVIGGGIIGINVARQLKSRFKDAKVTIIEKEEECGYHASGRNSGVLHAGFYYTSDSLKAKFTRTGNQLLTEYCDRNNLRINKCGKLVVTKNENELESLNELIRRGKENQIDIYDISAKEAQEIEPRIKTCQRALFSPNTSSIDPLEVLLKMKLDAQHEGIKICTSACYLKRHKNDVVTSAGNIEAKYVVNAAGLYADKIARDYGFSKNFRILPFKGLYLYSNEKKGNLRTHVYPVPNLRNPFLGVHFTLTVDGKIKLGPTAIPSVWREQYAGFDNFSISEFIEIMSRQIGLFAFSQFDFKKLALEELHKLSRKHLLRQAVPMLRDATASNFTSWGRPGIRAQLVDIRKRKLVMDFVLEGDHQSMHILNAVSPAFTCSIPFSKYVCDEIHRFLDDRLTFLPKSRHVEKERPLMKV